MATISSMLSRGPSRRQLSSINGQCEALIVGIAELQSERRSFLASAEEERSEAVAMESLLRGLQTAAFPPASPVFDGRRERFSQRAERNRCEEEAMQRERKLQEDGATNQQAMHQRLMRMRQLETEEEETIGVMTRLLHAQADRKKCEINCKERLTEEEVFQEELLRRSQEDLQERRLEMGKFGECQAYWDEMPFISNTSLDEQHAEVMQHHQEVQKLEVELERNESAAILQAEASRRHVDQLHLRSRLEKELTRLRTMAIAMPTEGLNGVLAATGARTAEHMKELLKKDLEVMRELQETLKDRKARCEKEKEHCDALRTLERRLKEGEEEDGD